MINDALDSLVTAVESNRTDVIQNVVKTVQKCEENGEGIGLTLNNLFRCECCEQGTILHFAVHKKSRDSVRALLVSGAFPSCKNEDGLTAFELADDKEIVSVFNEQLLHNIAQANKAGVEELLDAGCDCNCIDSEKTRNTPLHWAATYSTYEIVQLLIDDAANVNAQNMEGLTPLHDAVLRKDQKIVEILIKNQADPNIIAIKGKYAGKSCLDLADETVRQILQRQNSAEDEAYKPSYSSKKPVNGSIPAIMTPHGTVPSGLDDISSKTKVQTRNLANELSSLVKKVEEKAERPIDFVDAAELENVDSGSSMSAVLCEERLKLLWPTPRKLTLQSDKGSFRPADKIVIAAVSGPDPSLVHDILNAWRAKRQSFLDLHIDFVIETIAYVTTPAIISFNLPSIICHVDKNLFRQTQSYKLIIWPNQIKIVSSDLAGLHYAVSTLIQLFEIFDTEESVPCMQIHDWPDLTCRGVMLDCSKGRIPHEANLWELVDRLSILKINEVHLYTRFDLPKADEANTDIWQFPYSRSMLIEFDRFCQQRFVTLVPVLDVTANVAGDKIYQLYAVFLDYLSCFTFSRKINIGPRLSLMLLEVGESGILSTKNFVPLVESHALLLCAEALKQCDRVQQTLMWLPSNMMLMSYGYSASFDFEEVVKQYSDFGQSFYVCPGTSAWNSLAGCPETALANMHNAMVQGMDNGALGVVICDWSGKGYVTDLLFSLPSLVAGAGMAWNSDVQIAKVQERLAQLVDVHVLCDLSRSVGQVLMELGRLETELMRASKGKSVTDITYSKDSGSVMFQLLVSPESFDPTHLTPTDFQKAMRCIRHQQTQLQNADLHCYQGDEQLSALKLTLDLALSACKIGHALVNAGRNPHPSLGASVINVGLHNLPATVKTDLANRLLSLKESYKSCWFARNLPNGHKESQSLIFRSISLLLPSQQSPLPTPEIKRRNDSKKGSLQII